MSVVYLTEHPLGPLLLRVDWIKNTGWTVRTSPDDGRWKCHADNYDSAIIGAAQECERLNARPDPTCPHHGDIWIAIGHLRPEVRDA